MNSLNSNSLFKHISSIPSIKVNKRNPNIISVTNILFRIFYSVEEGNTYYHYRHERAGINYKLLTIRFDASFKTNVFETTVISLVDIFGMVGGVFELIQVFTSFMLGLVTERLLRKDFLQPNKRVDKMIKDHRTWFSYPPFKANTAKKKKVSSFENSI